MLKPPVPPSNITSALLAPAYFLKTVRPNAAEQPLSSPASLPTLVSLVSEVSPKSQPVQLTRAEGLTYQNTSEEAGNGSVVNVFLDSEPLPPPQLSKKMNEKYAGPSFLTAPPPTMLPKPQFSGKSASATNNVKNQGFVPQSLVNSKSPQAKHRISAVEGPQKFMVPKTTPLSVPTGPQNVPKKMTFHKQSSYSTPASPEADSWLAIRPRSFSRPEMSPSSPLYSEAVPSEGSLPPSPSNSPVASPPLTPGSLSPPSSRPSTPPSTVEPLSLDGSPIDLVQMTNDLRKMLNLGV